MTVIGKSFQTVLLLLMLLRVAEAASEFRFMSEMKLERFKEIQFLTTDLDRDEQPEFWVSPKEWVNGRAGNTWLVVVKGSEGYQIQEKIPVVRTDHFRIAEINGVTMVINYFPGSAYSGVYEGYWLDQGELKSQNLGSFSSDTKDSNPMYLLASSTPVEPIETLDFPTLRSRLEALDAFDAPSGILLAEEKLAEKSENRLATENPSSVELVQSVEQEPITTDPIEQPAEEVEAVQDFEAKSSSRLVWLLVPVSAAIMAGFYFARRRGSFRK